MKQKRIYLISVIIVILLVLIIGGMFRDSRGPFSATEAKALNSIESLYTEKQQIDSIKTKITELEGYLGGNIEGLTDYYLYIELAQQYMLLGEGEQAALLLEKAKTEYPDRSLPYIKQAGLFSKAGLLHWAESSYKKAVEKEPELTQNYIYTINFLIKNNPEKISDIQWYFDRARENTGDDEDILRLYAKWLTETGEYIRAYDIWKFVLNQNPEDVDYVNRELDRLTKIINNE